MSNSRHPSKAAAPAERRPDRRVERTRALLSQALLQLIVEKGFDEIAIQDITDRANVSRATFYLHYKDKDELLFSSMQAIYDELLRDFPAVTRELILREAEPADLVVATDFEHVAAHADFYRVMLSERGVSAFVVKVEDYLARIFEAKLLRPLAPTTGEPPVPLGLIARYRAAGEIGLMRWWLSEGRPYSPEAMARRTYRLCAFGIWWALGLDVPRPPLGARTGSL